MSETTYRAARAEDLPAALDVFFTALADMCARHHIDMPPPQRAAVGDAYRHVLETGIFRVAESGGRVVAICHAVVRGRLWFLSGFWALPETQGRGVGGALLREVWREGERGGAEVFFVWSSVDQTAMASYLRMGMLPGFPVLTLAGRPLETPAAPEGYAVEPLAPETACALDADVRGTRREADHGFFRARLTGRQVVRGGRCVGYFYDGGDTIGPAAWLEDEDAEAVLALALREACERPGAIMLRVPGVNHAALRFALGAGLRYQTFSHFLTTAPFGRLERYLASGPMLF